jgi:hypothetical protein
MARIIALGAGSLLGLFSAAPYVHALNEADIQRAIQRGVTYLKGLQPKAGDWPADYKVGLTALAGLTLLECGVPAGDPAVQRAAALVRRDCLKPMLTHHTYTAALVVLFLDRLGDTADEPLIDGLVCWLLTGQTGRGTWSYNLGIVPAQEARLLKEYLTLRAGADVSQGQTKQGKEQLQAMGRDIQERMKDLARRPFKPVAPRWSDHSNTQFAVLALWAGRRHGMPVEAALRHADRHFLGKQNPDGSWYYEADVNRCHADLTPADTCNGLLALAIGAAVSEGVVVRAKETTTEIGSGRGVTRGTNEPPGTARQTTPEQSKGKPTRLARVQAGLAALARVIVSEIASRRGRLPVVSPGGKTFAFLGRNFYCFLWSLDKMASAYDLRTLGDLDWYRWGAEIVLANQALDGSWFGGEGEVTRMADTCFALLFLCRSNVTKDLTAALKGQVRDPGMAAPQGEAPQAEASLKAKAVEAPDQRRSTGSGAAQPADTAPIARGPAREEELDARAARLAEALLRAPAGEQRALLDSYQRSKGGEYSQALAVAIPGLPGEARQKARDALAERLTRMTAKTVKAYLQDDDAELRAAAARACARKDDKVLASELIALLDDTDDRVRGAAHGTLQELAGQDLGPPPGASADERRAAAGRWRAWWNAQQGR